MSGVIPPEVTAIASKLLPEEARDVIDSAQALVTVAPTGSPVHIMGALASLFLAVKTLSDKYGAPAHLVAPGRQTPRTTG